MIVFSNTTPLFAFAALGQFDLLQHVHGALHVTHEVARECSVGGPITVPALTGISWIHLVPAPLAPDPRFFMLDAGERATLSAALQANADRVLIDERLARNLAEYHGLHVVGTLGTLLKAKQTGLIPAFLPPVRHLQQAGFWYHEPLIARLAALVGECP